MRHMIFRGAGKLPNSAGNAPYWRWGHYVTRFSLKNQHLFQIDSRTLSMTEVPQNVLERIRKCLALAASSNPGEAETAMQHARKLMEKYGLEKTDVELSEIGEVRIAVRTQLSSYWMVRLYNVVEQLLGVMPLMVNYAGSKQSGFICFIGPKAKLDLAKYLFTVLLRQISRDRRAYQRSLREDLELWRKTLFYSRGEKVALADAFCIEWLEAVNSRLKSLFIETPAITHAYVEKRYPNNSTVTARTRSAVLDEDVLDDAATRGKISGENADVFLAMGKHPDAEGLGLNQPKLGRD